MRNTRVLGCLTIATLAGALAMTGAAEATTGNTPLAHPPRYKVTRAQARPYLGRFKLAARGSSRRLVSAAYEAGYNEHGYVEGGLAAYVYGPHGREVSWVGRTYEYHHTAAGMTIDVISAANESIFARLRLRVARHGRLTGTLRELLPVPRRAVRITLRPVRR